MNGREDVEGAIRRLYEVRKRGKSEERVKVDMPESNRNDIIRYDKHLAALGKVGKARRMKSIDVLRYWTRYIKQPWKETTEEDLKNAVATLNETKLSGTNKENMKQILRSFYIWLEGDKEDNPPDKIKFLKPDLNKYARKANHKELITPSQVDLLVSCTEKIQEKLLIKLLFESACRIHELLTLQIGSLEEDEHGFKLRVDAQTKTGARLIRIIESVPLLKEHLKAHPEAKNPQAPFFYSYYGGKLRNLEYNLICHKMSQITRKAKALHPELVGKHLNFHAFRKARLTQLAGILNEQILKKVAGWTEDSGMARIYCDLSGKRVDDAVLEQVYGVKRTEKGGVAIKIKKCHQCGSDNDSSYSLCQNCNRVLSTGDAIKIDQTTEEMRLELMTVKKTLAFLEEKIITKEKLRECLRKIIRTEISSQIINKAKSDQ